MTQRLRIIAIVVAILVVALVIVAYEAGQRRAGFNRMEALAELSALDAQLGETSRELQAQRERVAILETAAKVDREAYGLVEAELADLQGQVKELEENLAFYRGIVAPDDAKGVQIQELLLSPADDGVLLQLYLTQALRSDTPISGSVTVFVAGQQDGSEVVIPLSQLVRDTSLKTPIRFRFRYFQEISSELLIPEGFSPTEVRVKASPDGRGAKTVEESFVWRLKAE